MKESFLKSYCNVKRNGKIKFECVLVFVKPMFLWSRITVDRYNLPLIKEHSNDGYHIQCDWKILFYGIMKYIFMNLHPFTALSLRACTICLFYIYIYIYIWFIIWPIHILKQHHSSLVLYFFHLSSLYIIFLI